VRESLLFAKKYVAVVLIKFSFLPAPLLVSQLNKMMLTISYKKTRALDVIAS